MIFTFTEGPLAVIVPTMFVTLYSESVALPVAFDGGTSKIV